MQITMTETEFAKWQQLQDQARENLNRQIIDAKIAVSTALASQRNWETKFYAEESKAQDNRYKIENLENDLKRAKMAAENLKVTTDAALADAKKQIVGPDAASELKVLIATSAVGNPKFNKIDVIRSVRLLLGGDLKQAKDLVEEALSHPTVTASLKKSA